MKRRLALEVTAGAAVAAMAFASACGDETTASQPLAPAVGGQAGSAGAGATGGGGGDGGATTCGSAGDTLPDGLVELAYEAGTPSSSVREQDWAITVDGTEYPLAEQVLNEAVRFELAHPARIHGFRVMWTGLPEGTPPETELAAGLYRDFGYNGFDFWPEPPLWSGTRCAADAAEGQWVTYAFPAPIELSHPGLVYVAHQVDGPDGAVWPFDETLEAECAADPDCDLCAVFDDCQSAMNLPEVESGSYFNGVSFPFQYHYLVRLLVEYTDELAPEERIFQPAADGLSNLHVSFCDYDEDGWDDLLLGGTSLWRNQGDGTFADATTTSGLAALGLAGTGGVWADYDNDGCLDLFVFAESYTAPDVLLRSGCDGTFTDVTTTAGILDEQTENDCGDATQNLRSPTAAAAWIDLDADGFVDLYLANFICWAEETYYRDRVWHNEGDGTFADWTADHGFGTVVTPSRCLGAVDHDADGDVDLFVGNYRLRANLLYQNQGDGTFLEVAKTVGAAGSLDQGYYGHTIGAAFGDIDADGDFDLVTGNLAHPRFFDFSDKTEVLRNDGTGHYQDLAGDWIFPASAAGLRYQETHSVPLLADFDLDGALDLAITSVYDGRPTDFYWGNGNGSFVLDAYHAGITTENGWGAAAADYDHDGDPDLFATTLFENRLPDADKGHWLQVRVVGNVAANRAAIGATVTVTADGVVRARFVPGTSGKGGQDSLYLPFGLGASTSIDEIRVRFPGGSEVVYDGPIDADQRVWLYEDGTLVPGWAP